MTTEYTIYSLVNETGDIYVGSTKNLDKRISKHITAYCNNAPYKLYNMIDDFPNGWNDITINILETLDGTFTDARKTEEKWRTSLDANMNSIRCYITNDERLKKARDYYQNHREQLLEGKKKYYIKNADKLIEYSKKRYNNKRDEISVIKKERYKQNRHALLAEKKQYYLKNRDAIIAKTNEYYKANRETILERCRISYLNKKKLINTICKEML